MEKVNFLFLRNEELKSILQPMLEVKPQKPFSPMEELEKRLQIEGIIKTEKRKDGFCSNCGAPNGHNTLNGKSYCFVCHSPFIRSEVQKPQKPKKQECLTFNPIL